MNNSELYTPAQLSWSFTALETAQQSFTFCCNKFLYFAGVLMAADDFLFSLTKIFCLRSIYQQHKCSCKWTLFEWVNQKFSCHKFKWLHHFDFVHTCVITNITFSGMRSMISWWVNLTLNFYSFRTNVCMNITPSSFPLCSFSFCFLV